MKTQSPLVSIIIPTYNRWKLLLRAIKSCLDQTHNNIEIIVIDDNSVDETKSIIQNLNNTKIKYIRNKTNLWPSLSRNKWIQAALGEYINFLDDDDELVSDKIEKQLIKFTTSNIDNLWVVTSDIQYKRIDKTWIQLNRSYWYVYKKLLNHYCVYWILSSLIDSSYIKKIWWFDPNLRFNEEYDFYIRLSQYCNFDYIESIWWIVYASHEQITQDYWERIIGLKKLFHKYRKVYRVEKCYSYNIVRFVSLYCKYRFYFFLKKR